MDVIQSTRTFSKLKRIEHRRGLVLARYLIEILLVWFVVWGAVVAIPMILQTTIRDSSADDSPMLDPIHKLVVTANGQQLWIQRGTTEIVSLDFTTQRTTSLFRKKGNPIKYWSVSNDGRTCLLSNDNREVTITRNQELFVSEELSGLAAVTTALSANGKTAVRIVGGKEARSWDLTSDEPLASDFLVPEAADKIALDSSGTMLVISSAQASLSIYDAKTGERIRHLAENFMALKDPVFSDDGNWLAALRGLSIVLFDVQTGQTAWTFDTPGPDTFFQAAFSRDGKWIAATGVTTGIQIFDRTTGKLQKQLPSTSTLHRIAFSTSSENLYSGSTDGSINLWSLSSGRQTQIFKLLDETN